MKPLQSFDELAVGQRFTFGSFTLTEAEIIAYAEKFDPQPFHTDPIAARSAPLFGGLVASGLHTMGACFSLILGSGLFREISLGGSEINTKWPAPLRPDEAVAVESIVESLKPSRSRPELGVAVLRHLGTRSRDQQLVIEMAATHFLKR
ncbi:MaoC/PaaZ C-terminal domain-containing protein [Sediminicoccus sp. KRV36]|uniref:MaoC/PaaZ C-terminal domain-containing protein n=1 Tax=Sediminicoccus sp. KRV36 TaxID=3133721 RepID=UPI00200FAE31|nr:MaoC/PaaZ C-terminal domain-containing protein [Sediminicoccus rosea]UPY38430.1 dehydratase [Sediminicoccus rosea]